MNDFAKNTGSLVNHLYSRMTVGQPVLEVGMGATILCYSDRRPATIVKIETLKNGDTIIGVQEDDAKRIDSNGMSECQEYEYTPNENAYVQTFRRRGGPSGSWEAVTFNKETKRYRKGSGGNGLRIGERQKYHDFSF